jgi:hypothetical protein
MEPKEIEKCCQAIEEGELIFVENVSSHQSGRLLYCDADGFQVEVEGKRQTWPAASCEEVGTSSESPHGNV